MSERLLLENKEELLQRVEERAAAHQYEYRCCSQATLLALQQEFCLPGDTAILKAVSFGGRGMARLGTTCGALLGSIIAFGLYAGRTDFEEETVYPDDMADSMGLPNCSATIREFYHRFVAAFGGSTCREVQIKMLGRSFDLTIDEENDEFSLLSDVKCSELVGKAARMAAETIMKLPRR